jgi:imidazoleglycerol-phosphate dehydratase
MESRRLGKVSRKTKETEIEAILDIDGEGSFNINTGIPFFTHLLELFTKHGRFNIELRAEGDIEVDFHHLVEDIGIVLGQAFGEALGQKRGIRRYSWALVPMDETLVRVSIDLSGRPYLDYNVKIEEPLIVHFNAQLIEEFIRAFVHNASITFHLDLIRGKNAHHIVEAVFKAFGIVLREAAEVLFPGNDIPTTKGVL